MDELVRLVAQKTGLSEDLARQAVEAVVDFLKDQLPEALAAQVDALLEGKGADLGGLLQQGLGGLFD